MGTYYQGLLYQPDCHLCPLRLDKKVLPDGPIPADLVFCGEGPGCLLPEQFIEHPCGPRPIAQLHGTILSGQVKDRIAGAYNGRAVEIRGLGIPLNVTAKHKILVRRVERKIGTSHTRRKLCSPEWVRAEEVTKEMFLVLPKQQIEVVADSTVTLDLSAFEVGRKVHKGSVRDTIGIDEAGAICLGLFLGDGSSSSDTTGTASWNLSTGYKEKYVSIVDKWLESIGLHAGIRCIDKRIKVSAYSTKLNKFLSANFYSKPVGMRGSGETKRVPDFVWRWPRRLISAFLFGWHEADGKHLKRLESPKAITTVSREAAMQAVWLCLSLGFVPTLELDPPRGKSKQPCYTINIGNSDVRKLGWPLDTHQKKSRRLYQEDENNFYVPVNYIRSYSYVGPVYDLTTESSMYCTPFAVHNSNEQREGRGFVGASGVLLWNHLAKPYGITRDMVWVTNSHLCAPRDVKLSTGAILYAPQVKMLATKACRKRLIYELMYVTGHNPNAVIVPLGNLALWALTMRKNCKVFSYRGSVMPINLQELWKYVWEQP